MTYQPVTQPTAAINRYLAALPSSVSSGFNALSSSVPTSSIDSDFLVTGGTTLATGYSAYKYATAQAALRAAEKTIEPGAIAKFKFSSANLMGAARTSAIFAGVISTAENLMNAWSGKQTGTRAVGNISADVAGAFGTGLVAAGAAGMITGAIGLTGAAVGIVGAGIGAGIYFGVDLLYRHTGLHRTVSDTITNFLDSLFGSGGGPGHGGM